MENQKLYSALTYAGALPFLACAFLPYAGLAELPKIGMLYYVAQVYGLVILSFMAGVHWGTYLYNQESAPQNLFITSNIVTVVAWLVFLLGNPVWTLLVLMAGFLYLLLLDYQLHRHKMISDHYLDTRRNVSALVTLSLIVIVISVM